MNKYNIIISELAKFDIADLTYYIKNELQNPIAAINLAKEIRSEIRNLAINPHLALVQNMCLAQLGLRKISVKNYIIFYSIDEKGKVIYIERVLYGRRDWENLL